MLWDILAERPAWQEAKVCNSHANKLQRRATLVPFEFSYEIGILSDSLGTTTWDTEPEALKEATFRILTHITVRWYVFMVLNC